VFDKIYGELKAVPVTMILMAILYIAVVSLYKDHVSVESFNSLREQISGVQYTLRFDHMDTRKHQIETELFNLNNIVSDKLAHHIDVDQLYYRRIDDLKNEKDEIDREIVTLEASAHHNFRPLP